MNNTEIQMEIVNFWFLIIVFITGIVFGIFILILIIKDKIHHSYHKGYREGNNDNLKYYEALKEIEKSYNELTNSLGNQTFNRETYDCINKHRKIINEYKDI